MEREFEVKFDVRYDECGAAGYLRPSVYLCYTQEAATGDARAVGWANSYWVVRRTQLRIHQPVTYPARLTVKTWVPGFVRTLAQRAYAITDEAGRLVAESESLWVNLDPTTLHPARVPAEVIAIWFPNGEAPAPATWPDWPPPPVSLPYRSTVLTGYSLLDGQQRVNNAYYLDLLDDAGWQVLAERGINLAQLRPDGMLSPSQYDLQYYNAGDIGQQLNIDTWFSGQTDSAFELLQEVKQGEQLAVRSRALWQWRDKAGEVAPLPAALANLIGGEA